MNSDTNDQDEEEDADIKRFTFGNDPRYAHKARQLNAQQLSSIEQGLERLEGALKPRLERYIVELLIHLCET